MGFPIILGRQVDLYDQRACRYNGKIAVLMDNVGGANAFGITIIAATAGYGKTVLLRNVIVQQVPHHWGRGIIFDFYNDYNNIDIPNFEQKSSTYSCVDNLVTINMKNSGIYLSDMSFEDWRGLDFQPKTTQQLMAVIRDNPNISVDEFLDIIDGLPTDSKEMEKYCGDVILKAPVNKKVKEAMMRNVNFVRELFISPDDESKTRLSEALFREYLLEGKCIRISFDTAEVSNIKMKTIAGVILRFFSKLLYLKPVFYIDESDKIFPNVSESDVKPVPSSVYWIIEYVRKISRRNNCMMFFIVQDFSALHHAIIENAHHFIIGANVAGGSRIERVISPYILKSLEFLRWDTGRNYREFLFTSKGGQGGCAFVPDDCLSLPKDPCWEKYL